MIDKVLYTARTRTTGGREGGSRSDDDRLDVKLTPPGGSGVGTNPEQLFAAGWSACFAGAVAIAARSHGVALATVPTIDAEVDLVGGSDGYALRARLRVALPGLPGDVARRLLEEAHRTCPYSRATRGNMHVVVDLA